MSRKKAGNKKSAVFRALLLMAVLAGIGGAGLFLVGARNAGGQDGPEPENAGVSAGETPPGKEEPEAAPPEQQPDGENDWQLVLVNENHRLDEKFTVDLKTITGKYMVDARIAKPLKQMMADAEQAGAKLILCSAYRSVPYQTRLYNNKVKTLKARGSVQQKAEEDAARIVAKPGASEHHTGLAIDFIAAGKTELDESFAATGQGKWLKENAWKYGFILRYPEDKQEITGIIYEPWHFRYVGKEHAEKIKENGQCLEEYLGLS